MPAINFSDGLVTFSINGVVELRLNPTDAAFVERLYNTFDALDRKQDEYKAAIERASGNREIFDIARKLDGEMRGMIDEALGAQVCAPLFGTMNVYALADGLPVWANLMLSIMDEVDAAFSKEQKATNPRLTKYSAKWHKK